MPGSPGSCGTCGAALPAEAAFCPRCGSRVGDRVPPNVIRVEPRYFGVAPATLLLVVAVAVLVAGIVLTTSGSVVAGVVVAAAAVPLFAAFFTIARRFPDSRVARAVIHGLDSASYRMGYVGGLVSAHARRQRRLREARSALAVLDGRRGELLAALGTAVYDEDEGAAARLRSELLELDEARARKESDMQAIAAETEREIEQVRFETRTTQSVEVPEPVVPEPPRVPEPYPPGELTPPEPPATPEPYPPPDEATPPVPPVVPEPYPPGESRR